MYNVYESIEGAQPGSGLPGLCVFSANYALFTGELCAQNPKLCANYANCAIFFSEKLNALCNEAVAIAVLQALTVLVAMASEKRIWRLNLTSRSPIWRLVQ